MVPSSELLVDGLFDGLGIHRRRLGRRGRGLGNRLLHGRGLRPGRHVGQGRGRRRVRLGLGRGCGRQHGGLRRLELPLLLGGGLYETKGKEKKIKLLKLTSVSSIDPRKPTVLKFATESKAYKFEFEDEKDCAIFAAGLRALAPAEATRGSIAGKKKDFLRVKVPTKPLGFLASSVVERDPARVV